MTDEQLIDDGGPEVVAVEADAIDQPQALWVRVGPVYYDNSTMHPEPGIWIEYQQQHVASDLAGPILLTPALWNQLNNAVQARLADWDPSAYILNEETP